MTLALAVPSWVKYVAAVVVLTTILATLLPTYSIYFLDTGMLINAYLAAIGYAPAAAKPPAPKGLQK